MLGSIGTVTSQMKDIPSDLARCDFAEEAQPVSKPREHILVQMTIGNY